MFRWNCIGIFTITWKKIFFFWIFLYYEFRGENLTSWSWLNGGQPESAIVQLCLLWNVANSETSSSITTMIYFENGPSFRAIIRKSKGIKDFFLYWQWPKTCFAVLYLPNLKELERPLRWAWNKCATACLVHLIWMNEDNLDNLDKNSRVYFLSTSGVLVKVKILSLLSLTVKKVNFDWYWYFTFYWG